MMEVPYDTPPSPLIGQSSTWAIFTVFLAYVSLGTIIGFVQGGIAPVLRAQGMELAAMRWVYALYIPFGLAFMWAPKVDAWRWPWLGRRMGWIATMQFLTIASVIVIAFIQPVGGNWPVLVLLGLVATASSATMDLALDALTVERLAQRRPTAAAAKMAGISLGSVLGGGILVAAYPAFGWRMTMLIIAAIILMSTLWSIPLRKVDVDTPFFLPSKQASIRSVLSDTQARKRLLLLSLVTCTLLATFSFNRLLLVDMRLPLESIGSLLGTSAPLLNGLACLPMPWLMRRMGAFSVAWRVSVLCVVGTLIVGAAFPLGHVTWAICGALLSGAGAAALYVVLGSLILEWAEGSQAATDYALFYGLGRLIAIVALVGLPSVIQSIGWPVFQILIASCFGLAMGIFLHLFSRR